MKTLEKLLDLSKSTQVMKKKKASCTGKHHKKSCTSK